MEEEEHGTSNEEEEFYGFTCMSLGPSSTKSTSSPNSASNYGLPLPLHHNGGAVIENMIAPADELFFKGQLLPLELDSRLNLMKTLILSSNFNPNPNPNPSPSPSPSPASCPKPNPNSNATPSIHSNGISLPHSSSFRSHNSNNSSSSSSSLMWESFDKDGYNTSISSSSASARDSNGSSTQDEASYNNNNNNNRIHNNSNNNHHPWTRLGRRSSFVLLWKPLFASFRRAKSSSSSKTTPFTGSRSSSTTQPTSSSQRFHTLPRMASSYSEDLSKYRVCVDRHNAYRTNQVASSSTEFNCARVPREKVAKPVPRCDRSLKDNGVFSSNASSVCHRSNQDQNISRVYRGDDPLLAGPKASEMKSKSSRVEEFHAMGHGKQGGKLWQGYSRRLKALYDIKITTRGMVNGMGQFRSMDDGFDIESCNYNYAQNGALISSHRGVNAIINKHAKSSSTSPLISSSDSGTSTTSMSSMQELHSALQSAIEHCKQSNNAKHEDP